MPTEPLNTINLKGNEDFKFPSSNTPEVNVSGALAGIEAIPMDSFTKQLKSEQRQTEQNTVTSFADYLNAQLASPTRESLQAETYSKEGGVDDIEMELNDINSQILQEQHSLRRKIESIEKQGGGLKTGASAEIQNLQRESLRKQADLAVIQMSIQGRYDSAKAVADRAVEAIYADEQKRLNARRELFEFNKDLFDKADQRAFEVSFSDRERQLDAERDEEKLLQNTKIEAIKMAQLNGAPSNIIRAIQTATSPEDVYEIGGQYASVDLIDRAIKSEQLKKLRAEPDALVPTQVIDQGGRKILINSQTGEVIKDFGETNISTSELEEVVRQEKNTQIDSLISHKGLNSSVGAFKGTRIGLADTFSGAKDDFIAGVDSLTKNLTLQTLIEAKANGATFGALSEGELRLLAESASKINQWRVENKDGRTKYFDASEDDFKAELDKIAFYAKLDALNNGSQAEDIGAITSPDGKVWMRTYDGNLKLLK